jgi:hypothetical protein
MPVLMLCAGQSNAPRKEARPAAAAKNAAKKKTPAKPAIPAGAVQTGPNSWRYTDQKGETWIYRKTPFGVSRIAVVPPAPTPEIEIPAGFKAVQVGDEIQFERPAPFGVARWSRKPDQLNEIERKVWERDRPQSDVPPDAKDPNKE